MKDLDEKGIYKYNQRKRVISPNYVCFPNSLCSAWEIVNQSENCWNNVLNYQKDYKSVADKFTYFLRFEPIMREVYKFYFPTEYKTWIDDKTKDQWLYSDNSYPPNEVFKVICIGFNLFLNMNRGDMYDEKCYIKYLTIDEMKKEIDKGKPIVSSFKLGDIHGHLMTIKGYDSKNFFVYDSYGCSYLEKFKSRGNAKIIPFTEFEDLCKPLNEDKKMCVCFS